MKQFSRVCELCLTVCIWFSRYHGMWECEHSLQQESNRRSSLCLSWVSVIVVTYRAQLLCSLKVWRSLVSFNIGDWRVKNATLKLMIKDPGGWKSNAQLTVSFWIYTEVWWDGSSLFFQWCWFILVQGKGLLAWGAIPIYNALWMHYGMNFLHVHKII